LATLAPTILIAGAPTLERYTEGILREGLQACGASVRLAIFGEEDPAPQHTTPLECLCDEELSALIQIHGSPEAEKHDRVLLAVARERLLTVSSPTALLLHRPDEIGQRFGKELSGWRFDAKARAAFVLLGTMFKGASFLSSTGLPVEVIPHGFFKTEEIFQESPIIIGAHTGWGEMRSLEHATRLLAEIFKRSDGLPIVGYLGGGPKRELALTKIEELLVAAGLGAFELVQASQLRLPLELANHPRIIVSHEGDLPPGLALTFNLQLYHLGGAVRRGESSGSLHRGVSIPVILEMNGAEILEDLRVIKVPYADPGNASSADWGAAADRVVSMVKSGQFKAQLAHNAGQAKKFSPFVVAERYLELFPRLA